MYNTITPTTIIGTNQIRYECKFSIQIVKLKAKGVGSYIYINYIL